MAPLLNVYTLPRFVEPEQLAGGTVVVIDVLRASTTIVHALQAGAAEIIPCREVDEALTAAGQMPSDSVLLGGERGGEPIDGFHLGNSPSEYTAARVGGKSIVFTTTNGTAALVHARCAQRILVGAFVNATAVTNELVGSSQIHLLCAGTNGEVSQDDVLLAGMLAERVRRRAGAGYKENAQAVAARKTWLRTFTVSQALGAEPLVPRRLAAELAASLGGENLTRIGLEADILAAAQIDLFTGVAEFDAKRSRIRLA